MSERKKHIAVLKEMLEWMNMSSEVIKKDDPFFRVHEHRKKAVKYAISSLETDEAYNLMYEQPEFCKDTLSRKELLKKWEETTPRGRTEFDQIIMSMSSVLPKATKNDCENCIHNKGVLECDMYGCKYESTTKNDLGVDAISRQEAIDTIRQLYLDLASQKAVIDILKVLSSVTPQKPKTGHWYRQTNDYVDYYECSECGMAMGLYDVKSYCPNCGSRNEVEE